MTPEKANEKLTESATSGSIANAKATLDAGADAHINIHKLYEVAITRLVGNDFRKLQSFELNERYEYCELHAYDGHNVVVKREGRTGRWFVEFKHRHEYPIYFESADQLEKLITTDLGKNPPEPVLERRAPAEHEIRAHRALQAAASQQQGHTGRVEQQRGSGETQIGG